jgi:hypothetical protein
MASPPVEELFREIRGGKNRVKISALAPERKLRKIGNSVVGGERFELSQSQQR